MAHGSPPLLPLVVEGATAPASLDPPHVPLGVVFGRFRLDLAERLLFRDEVEVALAPRAMGVLVCLIERAGQIVPKQALFDSVWKEAFVTDTSLAEAVSLLRQTLGDDPQQPTFVQTIPRRGYRFVAPIEMTRPTSLALQVEEASPPSVVESPVVMATDAAPVPNTEPVWGAWVTWLLMFTAGAALASAAWSLVRTVAPPSRPLTRFSLAMPAGVHFDPAAADLAIAPDGSAIAFVGRRSDGSTALYLRPTGELDARVVTGSENAAAPFFSPDGAWIGFFADGRLKKASRAGGAPIALCDAPGAYGAAWTDRGDIVFASQFTGGLQLVRAAGGDPRAITTPDVQLGDVRHWRPDALPGGRAVLFTALSFPSDLDGARLAAVTLDDGRVRTVLEHASFGRYSSSGHVLFSRSGSVFAAPFDAQTVGVTGPAAPVLEDAAVRSDTGDMQLALSRAGILAVAPTAADAPPRGTLLWIESGGRTTPATAAARSLRSIALSADGARLAASINDGGRSDIWIADLERGARTRLTFSGQNTHPIWSPDGRSIAFAQRQSGAYNLVSASASGEGPQRSWASSAAHEFPTSWSRDGRHLIYTRIDPDTGADIWVASVDDAAGAPRPLIRSVFSETGGVLSPDGRRLAYESNHANGRQVYVSAFPDGGAAYPVSTEGGTSPFWSDDGRSLYFTSRGRLMAASVEGLDREFKTGAPVALASHVVEATGARGRILIMQEREGAPADRIDVVLEWFDVLREKLARIAPTPLVR